MKAIGTQEMTWGEALRLTKILSEDPGSQVAAALWDWEHPMSREALVFADLYDLQHQSKSKHRIKPYPRPFKRSRKAKPSASLSQDQIIEALRQAGHTAPIPMRDAR